MTTAALDPKVEYTENGATLVFAVPFRFLESSDLRVTRFLADGTIVPLSEGVDWTASGGEDDSGGSLLLTASVATARLRIRRATARSQQIDYETGDTFPAESHEEALDRQMLINQEQDVDIDDTATRAPLVPEGETAPAFASLADLEDGDILEYRSGQLQRLDPSPFAGKYYAGDGNGRLVPSAGTGNDSALRSDLVADLGATLVSFKASDANSVKRLMRERVEDGAVSLSDFKLAVETDWYNAFVRALAAISTRGGGVLQLPRGNVDVASASLGTAGLALPANIEIRGHGLTASSITVTGATKCNLFAATDKNGITVRAFKCIGNQSGDGTYNHGACFDFVHSSSATADMTDYRIIEFEASNFKAPWICAIRSVNATYKIRRVRVDGFTYRSAAGDSLGTAAININNIALMIGANAAGGGGADQIEVRNLDVSADYIKTGLALYYACTNARLSNIRVVEAGKSGGFADNVGCYAVQIYDYNAEGANVTIDGFELSARSCGIYSTNTVGLRVFNGRISGHTDIVDATLPKGALVFNGNTQFHARNVRFTGNVRDISIVGPSSGAQGRVDGVLEDCRADGSATASLKIRAVATVSFDGLTILNSRFIGTQYGAIAFIDADELVNDLRCFDTLFEGANYGFDAFALAAASASGGWLFEGCDFGDASRGLRARSLSGRLELRASRGTCTGSGKCFELTNSTDIHLKDLEGATGAGGTVFDLTGCQGTIEGYMRPVSGTTAVAGLGAAKPTHSGVKGDFVRSVNPTVPAYVDGTTPTNYVAGWRCRGAAEWLDAYEELAV